MEKFILQTRSGMVTVESSFDDETAANVMMGVQTPSDFAVSLFMAYKSGKMTIKQRGWMHKMAVEVATASKPTETVVVTEDFSKISSMFQHASKSGKLKYPKIYFEVDGEPLKIFLAGPNSKYVGCLQITDGGSYGNNKYYGRVEKDGVYHPHRNAPAWVAEFLREFAKSPAEVAHKYGARTGRCCFCNTPLTERSADAGFGDTCAKAYGLYEEWKFYTGNGVNAGKKPVPVTVANYTFVARR